MDSAAGASGLAGGLDEIPRSTTSWTHLQVHAPADEGPMARHAYRSPYAHNDDEDAVLVRLVRAAGDQQAAGVLFDRYSALVRRILMRTLGPFQEVEDHVQEAFIAFFRQLRTLKNDESVRAFLVSIAVRIARHELRHRRVRRILRFAPTEDLVDLSPSSSVDHEGREALRRLFAILDELDTPSRLVFTLRYLEEMELMEVAIAVGESLATVKRRLSRVVPIVNSRAARDTALSPYLEEVRRDG